MRKAVSLQQSEWHEPTDAERKALAAAGVMLVAGVRIMVERLPTVGDRMVYVKPARCREVPGAAIRLVGTSEALH